MSTIVLTLYVTGHTPRTRAAVMNLERLCKEEMAGEYEIRVVDVLEHPQLAEDEKIVATPTVIKELPLPVRRVIGDLSEREKVLIGLDLVRKG